MRAPLMIRLFQSWLVRSTHAIHSIRIALARTLDRAGIGFLASKSMHYVVIDPSYLVLAVIHCSPIRIS